MCTLKRRIYKVTGNKITTDTRIKMNNLNMTTKLLFIVRSASSMPRNYSLHF